VLELPSSSEAILSIITKKKKSVPKAMAQKKIYLSYVSEETGTHVPALQLALKKLELKAGLH